MSTDTESATMHPDSQAPQEPRDKTITVRVTAGEESDVILVASFDRVAKSDVMRDLTISAVRERAELIRAGKAVSRAAA